MEDDFGYGDREREGRSLKFTFQEREKGVGPWVVDWTGGGEIGKATGQFNRRRLRLRRIGMKKTLLNRIFEKFYPRSTRDFPLWLGLELVFFSLQNTEWIDPTRLHYTYEL